MVFLQVMKHNKRYSQWIQNSNLRRKIRPCSCLRLRYFDKWHILLSLLLLFLILAESSNPDVLYYAFTFHEPGTVGFTGVHCQGTCTVDTEEPLTRYIGLPLYKGTPLFSVSKSLSIHNKRIGVPLWRTLWIYWVGKYYYPFSLYFFLYCVYEATNIITGNGC